MRPPIQQQIFPVRLIEGPFPLHATFLDGFYELGYPLRGYVTVGDFRFPRLDHLNGWLFIAEADTPDRYHIRLESPFLYFLLYGSHNPIRTLAYAAGSHPHHDS